MREKTKCTKGESERNPVFQERRVKIFLAFYFSSYFFSSHIFIERHLEASLIKLIDCKRVSTRTP